MLETTMTITETLGSLDGVFDYIREHVDEVGTVEGITISPSYVSTLSGKHEAAYYHLTIQGKKYTSS